MMEVFRKAPPEFKEIYYDYYANLTVANWSYKIDK